MNNSNSPEYFPVALEGGQSVTAMHYAADSPAAGATLIVAHGAGAGQRHPFMVSFARALASLGFDVVTFNFRTWNSSESCPTGRPCSKPAMPR